MKEYKKIMYSQCAKNVNSGIKPKIGYLSIDNQCVSYIYLYFEVLCRIFYVIIILMIHAFLHNFFLCGYFRQIVANDKPVSQFLVFSIELCNKRVQT